jgi:hypothetical protein
MKLRWQWPVTPFTCPTRKRNDPVCPDDCICNCAPMGKAGKSAPQIWCRLTTCMRQVGRRSRTNSEEKPLSVLQDCSPTISTSWTGRGHGPFPPVFFTAWGGQAGVPCRRSGPCPRQCTGYWIVVRVQARKAKALVLRGWNGDVSPKKVDATASSKMAVFNHESS